MSTPYNPSLGDVVTVVQPDSPLVGDAGEVVSLLASGAVGVRIVQEESEARGQTVYFNAAQIAPVQLGR